MNILVVEDDEIIRQELLLLLKNALYDVTALERFDDVASKILMKDYDLVLLDLNLPYESGFDICTKVRKESDVTFIFITGRKESAD